MASTTPNMSLIAWDSSSDPYDHTQLSGNWTKVDTHNHTPGHGVRIPTDGIEDGAITTIKLADGAVTGPKLGPGAVTSDKLDKSYVHPLGSILLWYRPNSSLAVPTGWVIMNGQVLTAADHEFPGGGSITLPNADQSFFMAVTSLGSIGSVGGSATASLAHTHTVSSHSHSIDPHIHQGPSHQHTYGGLTDLKDAMNTQLGGSGNEWVHAEGGPDSGHSHGYTGTTDLEGTENTSATALTTNGATAGTGSALGSTNIVPPYIGVLPLLRVKL